MRFFFSFIIILSISLNADGKELSEEYDTVYKIYQEGDFVKAKEEALKLLPRAEQEKSTFYQVKLYFLLGYLASHTDDYGNAIVHYLEGARVAGKSTDKELQTMQVSIYKNIGRILGDYQHYELAHKFINQGLEIASDLDNQEQVKQLLENRIHELLENEKFDKALHQIDSLNKLFELDGKNLLRLKNAAGIANKHLNKIESAIENYNFVLLHGKGIDPEIYTGAIQNIGIIYFEKRDYRTALEYFQRQIEITKEKALDQLLFQALELAGKTYFLMDDHENAIIYLNEAIILDDKGDLKPDTYTVYEKLSQAYEKTGNIEQALHYKNIYTQKLEAFIARQKEIQELDKKYNIQLLAERHFDLIAVQQSQQEMENLVKIGLAAVAIFSLFGLGFYFNQYQQKDSEKKFEL